MKRANNMIQQNKKQVAIVEAQIMELHLTLEQTSLLLKEASEELCELAKTRLKIEKILSNLRSRK